VLIHIDGGRTNVWICSKVPYSTRESLATAGGLPEEEILFHHTYIGGDFGGKGNSRNTAVCYYLAKATGRPVKIVTDYVEELGAGNPRHHTISKLKTGVKHDGTIVAHTVEYIVDSGAYAAFKPYGTISGANQGAGPYRLPNVTIDSTYVYTNNIPGGFMRAPGEPQGVFAIESHLDDIARQMGMDPLDFRLKNLMVEGEETGWGEHLEHVRAIETLEAAIEASGYKAPKGPGIGRGIAVGDRGTGAGEGTAQVTLKPDGTVTIGTPIFDQGTGVYTILVQVAAEELSAPLDRIDVEIWNTDALTSDAGVAGSRATRVNSIVAYEAAQEAKRNLLELAAKHWSCPADALSFANGEVRRSDIEEAVRWQDLLSETGETISGRGHIAGGPRSAQHLTNFVAQVAEVHVDSETGETKLLKLTTAQETGLIVNPIGHQGQINGGVNQGIGYAMMEDVMVNEEGRVTTLSLGDYKLPNIKDLPEQITVNLDSPFGFGPYNVRSIGEGPHIPVAPAIANAVADATGARIRELPVTSERVYRAINDA
jgi:CO/xanthine dehydrogenase Mo-binding subunit